MSQIEVPGSFVFNQNTVIFKFTEYGGQELKFSEIESIDQLKKVLAAIANVGLQALISQSLKQTKVAGLSKDHLVEEAEAQISAQLKSSEEQLKSMFEEQRKQLNLSS